jgi:SAM-dependent methyltransferase
MSTISSLPQPGAIATAIDPDYTAIKTVQRATWASGDYSVVGNTLQIVGETLCEAADIRGGEQVLDVAAGNGNASLAAARRFADVTASDYVPALLERARRRAEADGLALTTREADAENLPFDDESFDAVLSVYGAMFTPNQDRTASELLRVCKRGGRVAMANWTPDGFIGAMFRVVGRLVPPPVGVKPASLWGTKDRLAELFPSHVADLRVTERTFNFRYRSPKHFVGIFRTYYGPVLRAFAALPEERRGELERDLLAFVDRFNTATDGSLVAPATYLEVVATKR